MKIINLLETTEEDRALISLATAIYTRVQPYAISSRSDDCEFVNLGTIGQLFDTPIDVLNPVTIALYCHQEMDALAQQTDPEDSSGDNIFGFWQPGEEMIILNRSRIQDKRMRTIITHELRHALDDYKSSFRAFASVGYGTARKKTYRTMTNQGEDYAYLAQPAEINARFVEVLHLMTGVIRRAMAKHPDQAHQIVLRDFYRALEYRRIVELFPEKEKSREYKRLVKRGVDFIEKELAHRRGG